MTAQIIDDTAIARQVREHVAKGVAELVAAGGTPPGLATVLIGEDPASEVYVAAPTRAMLPPCGASACRRMDWTPDPSAGGRSQSPGPRCLRVPRPP
jgi:hypothetical protein